MVDGTRPLAAVAALTLFLVACGSQPSGPARPRSSSAPSAAPSGVTAGELLFAALEPGGDLTELRDTAVAIVRLNGVAVAKAKFDPRQLPKIGPARPLPQPEARTAGGRVFFADAAGVVRQLTPDNKVAPVTSFPLTSAQQLLSFGVSPDGGQLVGAVFGFPPVHVPPPQTPIDPPFAPGDFTLQLLTARPGQSAASLGPVRRWAQSGGLPRDPLELVGWSSDGPVAMIDTPPGTTGTGGRRIFGHVAALDTAGRPGPPFGGYSCDAWSLLPDETVLCDDNASAPLQHFSVRRRDGSIRFRFQASGDQQFLNLSLSPDGSRVAYLVNGGRAMVARQDGGTTALPDSFRPQGWLDSSTVIGAIGTAQGDGNMALVRLDKPTKVEDLGFRGYFAGVVQGG